MTAVEWLFEKLPTIDKYDPYYSDIIKQAKEMEKQQERDACGLALSKLLYKQALNSEISDEEIEKQAYQFRLDYESVGTSEFEVSAFIMGMKKYREQLKNKL